MDDKRVLVWGLSNNRAGTEAVIYNYVKHIPDVAFDFLCYEEPLVFSDLFTSDTQNRYFVIPVKIQHPFAYTRALRKFMKQYGHEYCTLWFNVNDISNIDLLIHAKRYGIKRRITHMHNSQMPDIFITKFFSKLNWKRCLELTTDRWACSDSAGRFLYSSLDYKVIPNMVDIQSRLFDLQKRESIRNQLALQDSWIIGTVGRLANQKNQVFLIRLLPQILEKNPQAKIMLVGEGELRDELGSLACQLGAEEHVIFAGSQSDIQAYLSAFDVFAFPSLYEGLSLSILEAQFNGLPCVISDGVGEESVISFNTKTISLNDPDAWVEALLQGNRDNNALIQEKAQLYDLAYVDSIASNLF